MLKFLMICLLALVTIAAGKPQWLIPSTYTVPVTAIAEPSVALAAPTYVEPYYSSYAVTPWWSSYAAYPYAGSYW